jgi:hypothetical protein
VEEKSMTIGQVKSGSSARLINGFFKIARPFPKRRGTHNYTYSESGSDYMFDAVSNETGYMTGQGKGIKPGDYIVVRIEGTPTKYEVRAIDYYAAPPDLWTALLVKAG